MTAFWLISGAMIALALLFVWLPIIRQHRAMEVSGDEANIAVIKQQMVELDLDLSNGKLDQAGYAEARLDLEKALLRDVSGGETTGTKKPEESNRWMIPAITVIIPVVAISLYQALGNSDWLSTTQTADAPLPANPSDDTLAPHALEEMVSKLLERLTAQPNDLEGWTMLARSYMYMQRYSDAVGAYANAHRLAGDTNASLLIDYADAVGMANGSNLTGLPTELLRKALAIEPEHIKGLWMIGRLHYQNGDFAQAIDYFRRVARMLPPDSENARIIALQIQDTQTRIGPITDESTDQTPGGAAITVHIELDPPLLDQVSGEDILYIFARPVEGPRMPLAIMRKQVKDLPLTVTLNDSMAMSPASMLSNFSTVSVGARISKSGEAIPQAGDLRGSVSPVDVGSEEIIRLTINESVR